MIRLVTRLTCQSRWLRTHHLGSRPPPSLWRNKAQSTHCRALATLMASLIVARGVEPETTSRILIQATSRTRTDFDEYDAYNDADSLAGIDFDSIDALRGSYRFDNPVPAQATTSGATQPSGSSPGLNDEEHLDRLETASSTSTQYAFDEIDMNEAFLQELDLIERNALGASRGAGEPFHFDATMPNQVPIVLQRSKIPVCSSGSYVKVPITYLLSPVPILLEDNKVSTGLSTQLSTPCAFSNTKASAHRVLCEHRLIATRKRKRSSHEERASSLSKRSRVDGKSRLDHRAVARGVLAKLEECFNCPMCVIVLHVLSFVVG